MGTRAIGTGVESTWGTTVAADDWSEVLSETLGMEMEFSDIKTVRAISRRDVALLKKIIRGDVTLPGNMQDFGRWLYGFYGTVTTTGAGPPYTHKFPATTGTTGRAGVSLTVDVTRDSNIRTWRYIGNKVTGLSWSVTQDEPMSMTASLVGKDEVQLGGVTGTDDTSVSHATIMTDSTASFTASSLIGLTINNTTDNSSGTITANDATTITCSGGLSGGSEDDWDSGDGYTITPATATYKDLDLALPKDISVSFDGGGTTLCGQSFTLNAAWAVDETVCLGSQVLSREPTENDTMLISGDVTILFEDAEAQDEYTDYDGTTDVDVRLLASDGTHSVQFDIEKCRFTNVDVQLSGRERVVGTFTFEGFYNTDATESMLVTLINDDADVTA